MPELQPSTPGQKCLGRSLRSQPSTGEAAIGTEIEAEVGVTNPTNLSPATTSQASPRGSGTSRTPHQAVVTTIIGIQTKPGFVWNHCRAPTSTSALPDLARRTMMTNRKLTSSRKT